MHDHDKKVFDELVKIRIKDQMEKQQKAVPDPNDVGATIVYAGNADGKPRSEVTLNGLQALAVTKFLGWFAAKVDAGNP